MESNPTKMLKNAIECVACGDIIESETQHDFKFCKCRSIAIDGGKNYRRIVGHMAMVINRAEYFKNGTLIKKNELLMTPEQRNKNISGDMTICEALCIAKICDSKEEVEHLLSCKVVKQKGYIFRNLSDKIEPLTLHQLNVGQRVIHNILTDETPIIRNNDTVENLLNCYNLTRHSIPGWYDKLFESVTNILDIQPNLEIKTIKRKFGFLCFYTVNAEPEVQRIIDELCGYANRVCYLHGNVKVQHKSHDYCLCEICTTRNSDG